MSLVVIESPYSGNVKRNVKYARRCMKMVINTGDAPIASHLLYTQEGILNDKKEEERLKGIECGITWANQADVVIFFLDYGMSKGMIAALIHYVRTGNTPKLKFALIGKEEQ